MSDLSQLKNFISSGAAAQEAVDRMTFNATPLLCRSKVRECFLSTAKQHRPFNKFSRVSEATLRDANEQLRAWIINRVKSTPSKGVTL